MFRVYIKLKCQPKQKHHIELSQPRLSPCELSTSLDSVALARRSSASLHSRSRALRCRVRWRHTLPHSRLACALESCLSCLARTLAARDSSLLARCVCMLADSETLAVVSMLWFPLLVPTTMARTMRRQRTREERTAGLSCASCRPSLRSASGEAAACDGIAASSGPSRRRLVGRRSL